MSTHVPGFQYFFYYFASFCIGHISFQRHEGQALMLKEFLKIVFLVCCTLANNKVMKHKFTNCLLQRSCLIASV